MCVKDSDSTYLKVYFLFNEWLFTWRFVADSIAWNTSDFGFILSFFILLCLVKSWVCCHKLYNQQLVQNIIIKIIKGHSNNGPLQPVEVNEQK